MRSESGDRLRSLLEVELQIIFIENMKNIATKYVMKIYDTLLTVQLGSWMSKLSFRKGYTNR